MGEINTTLGFYGGNNAGSLIGKEDTNCNDLENMHQNPTGHNSYDKKLNDQTTTTATANIKSTEAGCTYNGKNVLGSSKSSYFRKCTKKIYKKKKINIKGRDMSLESFGSILLSPQLKELSPGVYFCESLPEYSVKKGGNGCHAELSILSTLGKAGCLTANTSVLLNINWSNRPRQKKSPCKHCYDFIQQVAKECDVDIQICSEKGNPVSVKKDGKTLDYNTLKQELYS